MLDPIASLGFAVAFAAQATADLTADNSAVEMARTIRRRRRDMRRAVGAILATVYPDARDRAAVRRAIWGMMVDRIDEMAAAEAEKTGRPN